MVALAPHLVRPLPIVVPAFDGARLDRLVGVGLKPLRRDVGRAPRWPPRTPSRNRRLEPRPPPRHIRRRGARTAAGARCARAERRLPLLRLPDRRLAARADRARRGGALRRRLRERPLGRGARARAWPRRRGARPRRPPAARSSSCARRTSSTRPGCGADRLRPEELHDEAEVPQIRPSRGTHLIFSDADLPLRAGAIVPAGGGARSSRCRGSAKRLSARPTTTTTATSHTCCRPRGRPVPAGCGKRVLRHGARPGADRRGVRGPWRPADLKHRLQVLGRHLAQGGAV